jgi:AcrR family transcriptional regulator
MLNSRMTAKERKKQILDKATELFAVNGYDRVRVSDLADACGITEPALYRYFTSKEKLYDAVLISLKQRLDFREIRQLVESSDDIEEILFAIAQEILRTFVEHKELPRLMMLAVLENHKKAKSVFTMIRLPFVEILLNALERLKFQKKIHDIEPIITARCFVGMVTDCAMGINLWNKWHRTTFSSEKTMNNNIGIYVRGLKIDSNNKQDI